MRLPLYAYLESIVLIFSPVTILLVKTVGILTRHHDDDAETVLRSRQHEQAALGWSVMTAGFPIWRTWATRETTGPARAAGASRSIFLRWAVVFTVLTHDSKSVLFPAACWDPFTLPDI